MQLDVVGRCRAARSKIDPANAGRDGQSGDDLGVDARERQRVAPRGRARDAVAHGDLRGEVVVAGDRQPDAERRDRRRIELGCAGMEDVIGERRDGGRSDETSGTSRARMGAS